MKKHLVTFAALLLVVAIAVPAFAAVEFKYGGEFRTRWISNDSNLAGESELPGGRQDNQNFLDQRLRLYFTFIASENLRVVYRAEIGDITWGRAGGRLGASSGGEPGADAVNVETKNAYMEFNIPGTMVSSSIGIQGVNLLSSWIVDEDMAAAVVKGKFDPITARLGYVAGQVDDAGVDRMGTNWQNRIDSWFIALDYKSSFPLAGSLIGYYQFGHNTIVSADPAVMWTPPSGTVFPNGVPTNYFNGFDEGKTGESVLFNQFTSFGGFFPNGTVKDNNLFDLGLNLTYKIDWLSAYFNFVKNLGGLDVNGFDANANSTKISADYQGFMFDAGVNYFCGPFTANLGGFYTSGDELNINERTGTATYKNKDIDRFVYPRATTKFFSEILGGGILDNNQNIAHTNANGQRDYQWEAFGWPSNIWTVTLGGSYQVMEKTKVSGSYWYFGTSEDVVGKGGKAANDIGHELDFYLTQGITDGLNLDLVAAYLIKGDAYSASPKIDDAYELGARLIWSF